MGIAGDCVFDKNEIVTIKNISSLNIRVPHEIVGSAKKVWDFMFDGTRVYNTLIASLPTMGKTTILKDLLRIINDKLKTSVLVIDERGEFARIKGEFLDFIRYSDKFYAFSVGVRSLAPKIIVTDELVSKKDWECVKTAVASGISVVASCHANDICELKTKTYFSNAIFDRLIFLNGTSKPGEIKSVYDGEFNLI